MISSDALGSLVVLIDELECLDSLLWVGRGMIAAEMFKASRYSSGWAAYGFDWPLDLGSIGISCVRILHFYWQLLSAAKVSLSDW